ncbi:uncharacterized protein LOC116609740 [Nematostella vectensis]|uniref:uncharacterized protein LOC116609740 n=1 Tax=Nematostella vectensis TaxID=45351 RepID=UPI00207761D2|nr:uncharacterized protein LOC116609740 [Nematostella vectensis]
MWTTEVNPGVTKKVAMLSAFSGSLALIDSVCGFVLLGYNATSGDGLWSGLGMAVSAVLGILLWKFRLKAIMVAFLVINVLLVVAMSVQAVSAGIAYHLWSRLRSATNCRISLGRCRCTTEDGQSPPIDVATCDLLSLFDTGFLILCVASSFGVIVALIGATLGCQTACCDKEDDESYEERGNEHEKPKHSIEETTCSSIEQTKTTM